MKGLMMVPIANSANEKQ